MLAEVIVATRERQGHVEPETREAFPWAGRALDADRSGSRSLLAAHSREELVEIVGDLHAATPRRSMSPIWHVAPR